MDYLKCIVQKDSLGCTRALCHFGDATYLLGVTCMAGYMSGVAGTIISNPADNMITAINKRKGLSYVQAAKSIGLVGLFTRSLPLRVMLVGPLVTAQWFCYDSMKVLVGLPTSGGVEHLISDQDGL